MFVADTPELRRQGLRDVTDLGGRDGMLFVYSEPSSAAYEMVDALIPLDIWWFDGDGVLLGSTRMEPCETEPCPVYASPGPIGWALETPAGERDFVPGVVISTVETP